MWGYSCASDFRAVSGTKIKEGTDYRRTYRHDRFHHTGEQQMKTHILLAGLAWLSVVAVAQQSNGSDQKTNEPKAQLRESPSKASLGRRESPTKPAAIRAKGHDFSSLHRFVLPTRVAAGKANEEEMREVHRPVMKGDIRTTFRRHILAVFII